jgi:hypothetical protein
LLPLVPDTKVILGGPPSFETVTRDTYPADLIIHPMAAFSILVGISSALEHLHHRGISHGDLYAHNILIDRGFSSDQYPLIPIFEDVGEIAQYSFYLPTLCDFGASSTFSDDVPWGSYIPKLEIRAFGCLVDDILARIRGHEEFAHMLSTIRTKCLCSDVLQRPTVDELIADLMVARNCL